MTADTLLDDLHFTAFMSSKICHDLVGPVGAISNGLELLDEETDEETREYALELIKFSAGIARIRLEFARLAYGASTALGKDVDLHHAITIIRPFVEEGKHKLHWNCELGSLEKTRARLLMTLLTVAMHAIPAGGDLEVNVTGSGEAPNYRILCQGRGARIPEALPAMLRGNIEDVDPRSVITYYVVRLAQACNMALTVRKDGADIVFEAKSRR